MDNVPPGTPRDQWTSYVDYHYKKETQEMCKEMLKLERNKSFRTQVDPKLTLEEGLK